MQPQRTMDGAPSPQSPEPVTAAVVSRRSARRATARRASNRRAAARQWKDDIEGRITQYLKNHPQSTTGDLAKGLNADRGTIAASLSNMLRGGKPSTDHAAGGRGALPGPPRDV